MHKASNHVSFSVRYADDAIESVMNADDELKDLFDARCMLDAVSSHYCELLHIERESEETEETEQRYEQIAAAFNLLETHFASLHADIDREARKTDV
jgi:hypothetical protein